MNASKEIAKRLRAADPRAEPRIRARVPFLVREGPANSRLIDLTVTPEEMLAAEGYKLNVRYYISKRIIPTLNRCLAVFGADKHCQQWLTQLPKYNRIETESAGRGQAKGLIHHHFSSTACLVCEADITRPDRRLPRLCDACSRTPVLTSVTLAARLSKLESLRARLHRICTACTQFPVGTEVDCVAVSCPVTFEREKVSRQTASEKFRDMYSRLGLDFDPSPLHSLALSRHIHVA